MATECNEPLNVESYQYKMHLASIFIVFGISLLGTMIPVVFKQVVQQHQFGLNMLKLFGCGVLLATAVIHMIVPSLKAFENECLPDLLRNYESYGGVFILAGLFSTHLVQIMAKHYHYKDYEISEGHQHETNQKIVVYLIELGVASHSILIGIFLGVSIEEFYSLLIALSFHQFFEGMALSSIVISNTISRRMRYTMILFYSATTSIVKMTYLGNFNWNCNSFFISRESAKFIGDSKCIRGIYRWYLTI
eukprot:NODE_505_length_6682_cov_0.825394.p3 type:complete len:249 gc:universal NODE_505_length_6682_cov_0.825394:3564-4310(+)